MKNHDDLTDQEKNIIFYYIQNYWFNSVNVIEDREMAQFIQISLPTLKKRMRPLVSKKIIKQVKERLSVRVLSEDVISNMEDY